jgi:hypothetical protein
MSGPVLLARQSPAPVFGRRHMFMPLKRHIQVSSPSEPALHGDRHRLKIGFQQHAFGLGQPQTRDFLHK